MAIKLYNSFIFVIDWLILKACQLISGYFMPCGYWIFSLKIPVYIYCAVIS